MKNNHFVFARILLIGCLLVIPLLIAGRTHAAASFWTDLKQDHRHFYSLDNLAWIGAGVAVGGVLANTDLDEEVQDYYRDEVRSSSTDSAADVAKLLGEKPIALLYAGLSLFDADDCESTACRSILTWGNRNMRALIVGLPPVWASQYALGGMRPDQGGSEWTPFEDTHGVSGHAFVGALPLLTAAGMTDNVWLKGALYTGSFATGWSRINDDKHFLSQALLGWWYAYRTVQSVNRTERAAGTLTFMPFMEGEYTGLTVKADF